MLAASILEDYQSDFCPKCGTLVDLDTNDSVISCQACKQKLPLEQFIGRPIKTSLRITTNKQWLNKYDTSKQLREKRGKSKMVIQQKCSKCGHHEMQYHVLQTRGADEGSTVFYQCGKCGHTHSANN